MLSCIIAVLSSKKEAEKSITKNETTLVNFYQNYEIVNGGCFGLSSDKPEVQILCSELRLEYLDTIKTKLHKFKADEYQMNYLTELQKIHKQKIEIEIKK